MSKESNCARKINTNEAMLIVIDMQEKIIPAMNKKLELINSVKKLVRGSRILDLPIIFTQQYSKGLGQTLEEIKEEAKIIIDDPEENVTSAVDNPIQSTQIQDIESFSFVEKYTFSVCAEPDFVRELKRYEPKDIIICGIESHVCLQQSVLDFLDEGYNVFVAADACSSRSVFDYETSLSRMEAAGAVITTVESIIFEVLHDAKNPKFKEISKLVK